MNKLITWASATPWLSGGAVWALTAASAALNAWGWAATAIGLVALVLVTLAICSEVLGVRLALRIEDAAARKAWAKALVAGVLMVAVVSFNAWSGHRALEMVERQRSEPYRTAQAARDVANARLVRVEREIALIPQLPANVPAVRLREYRETRNAELARLLPQRSAAEAELARLPIIEPPPAEIPSSLKWAIVVLIEALKALALWAVVQRDGTRAVRSEGDASNPARALAEKRWGRASVAT